MTENPGGTQTIRIYCAKQDPTGGGTLDLDAGGSVPTIEISVFDGATPVYVPIGSQGVTSGTGQWISWTFDAADLVTADGSGVNITVTTTNAGGGPNERSVAIDSIEWVAAANNAGASYDLDVYESGVKSGDVATGTITSTTGELDTGTWSESVLGTADGSNVELYITQTGGSEYLEIGAVEWQSATNVKGELYMGNSTDGATLVYTSPSGTAPFSTLGYKEVYSESPTVVPDTTEYARAGLGSTVANTGTVAADALIVMVLDAPNAGYDIHAAASLAPYNPHYRFRHLLTR
jgi:hypothetical protein